MKGVYMYFKEYILPLWYFLFSIIFLLFSIYYFLYRILVAKKFKNKRRIEERDFRYLYSFISGTLLIITSIQNRNNIITFLATILIGLAFYVYDYNFILKEGLFLKGRFISWNRISKLDYKKNNKEIVLSYFKNNNPSKISKVTFIIRYKSRLELENIMRDKLSSTNVDDGENRDKAYSVKSIKIGISLALIFFTLICIYGVYNLLQPRALGEVLEETFNHGETFAVTVKYEEKYKDIYLAATEKKEEVKEIKNYLNSFCIRKIQLEDFGYKYTTEGPYSIKLWDLRGDIVRIYISKKEPIIEIIRNNKKRAYFIEDGYKDSEFVKEIRKCIKISN